MNQVANIDALISLNKKAFGAEDKGRKFFKLNDNFTDAVNEARKLYNSVLLQECFVAGRNQAFWKASDAAQEA